MSLTYTLTYTEVARILSILDNAEQADLDFTLQGRRVAVTAWLPEAQQAPAAAPAPAAKVPAAAAKQETQDAPVEVRAQQIGYYRQPRGKGFGSGVQIKKGDPLGEIVGLGDQAHEVVSPADGQLVEVCVADGDFIEYGEAVVVLAPRGGSQA
jgi:biotin carboxyl carrier protein